MDEASSTGSFLSPVLKSVDAEIDHCGASRALILVLTDGQLHDLGSVEPSDTSTIIGLLPTADTPSRVENWKRVCPDSPLLTVSDPSLDVMIDAELGAETRFQCKVTPCSGIIETKLNSLKSDKASEISSEGVVLLPYGRSELSVVYDARPAVSTAITVSSSDGKCLGQWDLPQALKYDGELISACASVDGTLVFDSASGDFALSVEPLVAALRKCAELRTRWDTNDALRDFTSALSGVMAGDYLICFCGLRSRLVIFHICSDVSPAILWPTGCTTALGISTEQLEICYSRLERRWYLHGQSELEIDPRACQHLGSARFDSGVWEVYSSDHFRVVIAICDGPLATALTYMQPNLRESII